MPPGTKFYEPRLFGGYIAPTYYPILLLDVHETPDWSFFRIYIWNIFKKVIFSTVICRTDYCWQIYQSWSQR